MRLFSSRSSRSSISSSLPLIPSILTCFVVTAGCSRRQRPGYHSITSTHYTVRALSGKRSILTNNLDFGVVDWKAIGATVPAMLALTFFGILHVPINIPALGMTTGEDNVDVDRELRAHGYSNALSGLCGSIQVNLLVAGSDVSSELLYRIISSTPTPSYS